MRSLRRGEAHWIADPFRELQLALREREISEPAPFVRGGLIPRSLAFLQGAQNGDGSWGTRALFETNIALRALGLWRHVLPDLKLEDRWALDVGGEGGVALTFDWLERRQVRGRWEDNIWDTAGVIRAATLHDRLTAPCVQAGLSWLASQSSNHWGLRADLPPHYAAQALLAFNDAGMTDHHALLIDLLLGYVGDDPGLPHRSLYIAAQVAEALVECGVNQTEEPMKTFGATIEQRLGEIEVSSANFLDIASGFLATGLINGGVDERSPDAQRTLAKMLNPSRLRGNGSWYQNVLFTGWALVALSRVSSVITLEAVPLEVYTLLTKAHDEIASSATARLSAGRLAAALAIIFGMLVASAGWVAAGAAAGTINIDTHSNALWWVMGLVITLAGLAFRLLLRYERRRAGRDR
jgi:hypothetical protein